MSKLSFTAVIFDLDGVITQTALVHSRAWKEMFDEYLRFREKQYGEPFREFTHDRDYLPYVDGKPRYEGVQSFLKARGIDIPRGDPQDPPDEETVCGLGNRKNQKFNEVLERDGVAVYKSTVSLVKQLKDEGIRVGVASSSKNCKTILETAGIEDLFEVRIDGVSSVELNLKGKPEPDIFTTACDYLGAAYDRSVVVEDAVAGVQAGANGNFGLVVGVARENNERELKLNGADIVVRDLEEIGIEKIEEWFRKGLEEDQWSLNYYDYVPERERTREALCTVGNGYFGTRGAAEESGADTIHYPGTYLAGVYNRLQSEIHGKNIVNEDLVNCPNWLPIRWRIGAGPWTEPNNVEIIDFHRRLDLKGGILHRNMVVRDEKGRETRVESERLASMADPHCAALRYRLTPLNYNATITVRSGLVYDVTNTGVERYRDLANRHLELIAKGGDGNSVYVLMETNQSGIRIAEAAKTLAFVANQEENADGILTEVEGGIFTGITTPLTTGQTLTIEKLVSIYSSQDTDEKDPLTAARNCVETLRRYRGVKQDSEKAWESIWRETDIRITGDRFAQKLIRLNQYHLLITRSIHNVGIDWGIPARGLHGEAYRGHIFWDELFCLPFYCLHLPETAKSTLLYRYRRLDKAREAAGDSGYRGAMFPWQSGSDGSETTQKFHLNPLSGEWGEDHSYLQRHVSIAVAWNVWNYYQMTADREFLARYGAEVFFEVARFLASLTTFNPRTGRYDIEKVMGPDEFHEGYPDAREAGLRNNGYTNLMAAWVFDKAQELLGLLSPGARQSVMEKIGLTSEEMSRWKDIGNKLTIGISAQGVIEQFDGFFALKELDWDDYRERYGNLSRLDRILKAEGDSPDRYKVLKQADTLMLFYLLDPEEVRSILMELGYSADDQILKKNFDYYFQRTSHGSTLSFIVHAALANETEYTRRAWEMFQQSLCSDYRDIQGGTTGEGIHTGVMGGAIMHVLNAYAGLDFSGERLQINPALPRTWREIRFNVIFRKVGYRLRITSNRIEITAGERNADPVDIEVLGKRYSLQTGVSLEIELTSKNGS